MELALTTQAVTLLKTSNTPVIIIPKNPTTDALAAAVALLVLLERGGKSAQVVSPEFTMPPGHGFLPKSDAVRHNLSSLQNFIINVDLTKTKLDSLSYDIRDNQLHIYLAPKNGFFDPANVKTSTGEFAHDLIITLDLPDLERLGPLYKDNTEFFYRTPILNIDHHAANSRFGQVNFVDLTDSSVSEGVFEIVTAMDATLIDEQVATSLLAGIISKTKVFQSNTVTPRSLAVASHLVAAGGRRDDIIRHLYQTKTLPTLRVWGRALANLKTSPNQAVVWSTVTGADLRASEATPTDAAGVLDELMVNAPTATYYVLFIETPGGTSIHLNHRPGADVPTLPPELQRQSPQYLTGRVLADLATTTADLLSRLGAA